MDYNCKEMRRRIRFVLSKKIIDILSAKRKFVFMDTILVHVFKNKCLCLNYYYDVRKKNLKAEKKG